MTTEPEPAAELEPEQPVIAEAAAEIRKAANAPADTVLKYVLICTLILFGAMTWYSWQSNQRNPDRLYELIERQINQTSESLKVQESALKEIQEFSVRVPMEHQSAEVKLTMIDTNVARVDAKVDRISADNAALRDAIQSQIEVITKLVKAMEVRNGGGT